MLIYSAMFPIKKELTQDNFIELVIQWNQKSPHDKMNGVEWNGVSRNFKFVDGNRSLAVEELRAHEVIAARFRKEDENKIVWTTDFIMNFKERMLAVRLDREATEETKLFLTRFSPPHLVKLIIRNDFADNDNGLPVSDNPISIHNGNYRLIEDIILRNKRYLLPVVYVTKTWTGNYPLDVSSLAKSLQGVAHVLKETDPTVSKLLMESCNAENAHHGGIGIYYPSASAANKKINTEKYMTDQDGLQKKIVSIIYRYINQQRRQTMYTWEGVQNEILRLKNESLQEKRKAVEDENSELLDVFGEQLVKQEETIKELNNKISSLTKENFGLRSKLDGIDEIPLLFLGDEEELYEGEIREIVLDILNDCLKNTKHDSRREHIIVDLLENNDFQNIPKEKKATIKQILKGYSNMTTSMRQDLQEFGFEITADGKHYKLTYYNDPRYVATMAKSSSDGSRAGKNLALEIDKNIL